MKNIYIPKTEKEWIGFVLDHLIPDADMRKYWLVQKGVRFVVAHKAMGFYEVSDKREVATASSFTNWAEMRGYSNPAMQSLYYLHEIPLHGVFQYVINPNGMTIDSFINAYQEPAETVASNGSEIGVYRDIPFYRDKVFQDKEILCDRIQRRGFVNWPSVYDLAQFRRKLVNTDELDWLYFKPREQEDPVRDWVKQWGETNTNWSKKRFKQLQSLKLKNQYVFPGCTHYGYREELWSWKFNFSKSRYERLVKTNCELLYDILGRDDAPKTFEECLERVPEELEGTVFPLANQEEMKNGI